MVRAVHRRRNRRRLVVVAMLGVLVATASVAWARTRAEAGRADVLLLGDSIMLLGGRPAQVLLEAKGVSVALDAMGGTSPVGDFDGNVDWLAKTKDDAQQFQPHAAVIMFTGNYPRVVRLPEDADLCAAWGQQVRAMVDVLQRAGTKRVIVAASVPGRWAFQPDDVFACESAAVQGSGAELVDVGGIVGAVGSPRIRVEALPSCDDGHDVVVRTKDVHVTEAGARRIGQRLASLLDPRIPPPSATCVDG